MRVPTLHIRVEAEDRIQVDSENTGVFVGDMYITFNTPFELAMFAKALNAKVVQAITSEVKNG